MKKIDLGCPRCKAIMDVNKDKTEANCSYCGYKFLIKKDESIEEVIQRAKTIGYAFENRKNKEIAKKKRNRKIITIIAIIIGIIVVSLISYSSKEYIEDPFSLVKVSFSGTDGSGIATISYDNIKKPDISYSLSKNSGLENNEEIKLFVKSDKYRFKIYEKTLIVNGLLKYVNNFEEITSNTKTFINNKSYDYQKFEIENSYSFKGKIISLKPFKLYLGLKDTGNILFDIFEVKIKTASGKSYTKYVITTYENLVIVDDEVEPIKFDSVNNIGLTIRAGDSKVSNALDKKYAGYMKGFNSIGDIDNYLITEYNSLIKLVKE